MTGGYEFWLFDLDGTLVDVEPAYIHEIIGAVGDEIGYSFTEHQAVRLWRAIGGPPNEQLRTWGIEPTRFWSAFHDIEDPHTRIDATFLYPDATTIASLDCPVGLVTHCQSYLTKPVLEALDIENWFDTVVCCQDDIGWKPDPRPVQRAMDDLGVEPGAATGVLAGDSAADVGAAWNAGIEGMHIERMDPGERNRCVRADARISRFDEVILTSS